MLPVSNLVTYLNLPIYSAYSPIIVGLECICSIYANPCTVYYVPWLSASPGPYSCSCPLPLLNHQFFLPFWIMLHTPNRVILQEYSLNYFILLFSSILWQLIPRIKSWIHTTSTPISHHFSPWLFYSSHPKLVLIVGLCSSSYLFLQNSFMFYFLLPF